MATSSNALMWVHQDHLNPNHPIFQTDPKLPRVFIFDESLAGLSLKRITFIYECLLEIPSIEIYRGKTAQILIEQCNQRNLTRVITSESIDPQLMSEMNAVRAAGIALSVISAPEFIALSASERATLDLKRFSRYWRTVQRRAMSMTDSLF